MYKYTPKKSILREMEVKRVGAWWDTAFFKKKEILARYGLGNDYFLTVVLHRDYEHVCFFSETPVKQVPVRGHLFPVDMFDETVV